jgi:hypothetical protein
MLKSSLTFELEATTVGVVMSSSGHLQNHLVREWPKTVPELYEEFVKFSRSDIQHFLKLEQQRKLSKPDEAPRPWYNENQ